MKLVVFVLNREDLLEQVLEAYVEAGIDGATILDSEGMGRFLTYEVPLFAHLRTFMKGNKPYNKTILSIVRDESAIDRLKEILDEVTGGLEEPGTGILFGVPVDFAWGLIPLDGAQAPEPPEGAATDSRTHAPAGPERPAEPAPAQEETDE